MHIINRIGYVSPRFSFDDVLSAFQIDLFLVNWSWHHINKFTEKLDWSTNFCCYYCEMCIFLCRLSWCGAHKLGDGNSSSWSTNFRSWWTGLWNGGCFFIKIFDETFFQRRAVKLGTTEYIPAFMQFAVSALMAQWLLFGIVTGNQFIAVSIRWVPVFL